jgi:hypothetical protein
VARRRPTSTAMSPKWRRLAALALVVITLIGWPLSALTWAKDEPQFILGLSWLAITLTAVDVAATTDVRAEQDDDAT